MWTQYKKTLIPAQIFIVGLSAYAAWDTRNLVAAGVVFLVMQLGSLAGAWWGNRLRQSTARATSGPLLRG